MQAWFFCWNPSDQVYEFGEDELGQLVEVLAVEGEVGHRWSTGGKKRLPRDARVYLVRQGAEPRGIVGRGRVAGPVEVQDGKRLVPLRLEWLALRPPAALERKALIEALGDDWLEPRGSATPVPPTVAEELERRTAPLVEALQPPPDARLEAVMRLLASHKNLVLEGVPGTGKTHAFGQLVRAWDGLARAARAWGARVPPIARGADGGPLSFALTLHPATAYEDFVEGIRPRRGMSSGGGPMPVVDPSGHALEGPFFFQPVPPSETGWSVTDGFFLQVCARAAREPGRAFVVLLDELNRANLPKVMGDLLTTLERGRRARFAGGAWQVQPEALVSLPVSGRRFFVPDNVFVLATRNTADRSVAPLDLALRRRFAFMRVDPLSEDALRAALSRPEMEQSLHAYGLLNEGLLEALGPDGMIGHSWFFGVNSPADLAEVWEQQILPQVVAALEAAGRLDELLPVAGGAWPSGAPLALRAALDLVGLRLERRGEGYLAGAVVRPVG